MEVEALEIEPIEPKRPQSDRPLGGRIFTRQELEHCAAQAVMLRRHREHGFSLLAYANRAEPWRYGGRGPVHGVVRQYGDKIKALVDEAMAKQGGGESPSTPSAEEQRTAERINGLLAMDRGLLDQAIEARGRLATGDHWSDVMLAFALGVMP